MVCPCEEYVDRVSAKGAGARASGNSVFGAIKDRRAGGVID